MGGMHGIMGGMHGISMTCGKQAGKAKGEDGRMSEQAKRESERKMGCGGGGSVMRVVW